MPEQHTTEVEVWKPIPLTEGWYEASNLGRIREASRTMACEHCGCAVMRILPQKVNSTTGYGIVRLSVPWRKGRWTCTVHRLVVSAFLGKRPDNLEINHKNGKKTDNRTENLEFMTKSANTLHAFRVLGYVVTHAKFSKVQVSEIRRRHAAGGVTCTELAEEFKVSYQTIYAMLKRRTWQNCA